MKCKNWPIGVCSWSLQTDVNGVAEAMKKIGINHVHLGVRAALGAGGSDFLAAVQNKNWTISATMIDFPQEDYTTLDSIKATGGIGPDEYWEQNQELFLGATDVSVNEKNIMLLLETGQETAEELRRFLKELNHPAIGVNFDPANMILYDKGNPIEAVKVLAPWIKHIHIKDANQTTKPGTWGAEVPWGDGQVQTDAFLSALEEIGFDGTLAIEREAGNDRFGDVKLAAERLGSH